MISTSKTGAIGEHVAAAWFMEKGFEVFLNASSDGPADLVLWDGSKTLLVDIKTMTSPYMKKDGSYSLAQNPRWTDNGIAVVSYVLGEDSLRVPEGFWEYFT